ncbi:MULTISPECIES: efflux RND transporter permease subunit [Aliarcobacter]|jgi:hydrophobic/amphiphilic exporter-1 (mainly G- bacteria), HAE1 family|uniref:RND family efflux system, inner membrane transporter, AcrB family n=1 Tax=Aliarcobacter cibarius TaxID=255507 RepID=A0A7L5JLQ8_9BACT|nr:MULTISPECIES: efflux RND transporter permease subunit [Aliarcobacter]MBP6163914.1 efflux RND transporter permease subunit [Aliarcobacter sp.]MBP7226499.1 efflux RND transporter permease subunit [Aliarcobacter sp.]MBP9616319.1 efflux RND transporter permease subunit [Aliarcobacter sp.]MCG3684599.1 efflux RND transporter permease subunit [Aliarcobacter butzleri]MCG3707066.1 efflux RND transporter permease subunit [Aliarcobacter butzleri]
MYKFAISRPITTFMFVFALVFFGYTQIQKMPIAFLPNVDYPVVSVITNYDQGSTEIIESKITDKIEEAISGISGIDIIRSDTSKNQSVVIAQFELSKPVEEAANDVRDKVSTVDLPKEANKPIIEKFSSSSAPIITLFLSTKLDNLDKLMLHANEVVKPVLQSIEGVGKVEIAGFRDKVLKIYPDTTLLSKYNLDLNDLSSKIDEENIKKDGGRVVQEKEELNISIDSDAINVEQLENIKIKDGVRLKDVAKVEETIEDERTFANYNEQKGVLLQVKKISGANEVNIAKSVREKIPYIKGLSNDFDINLLFDTTNFIESTYKSVQFDLILGCFLASLIVFVFLRNFTFTIIAAISLPISILGVLAIMGWSGQTLNILTLTALTLSIGIIIDDAIVVIENIYKKLELGKSRYEAALEGVREISFSVLAISAMLLAIFIPIANMSGIVGKFFKSFGITIVASVIISYIVAITVIPMISSLLVNPKHSKFYLMTESIFLSMDRIYKNLLTKAIKFKFVTLISGFSIFAISIILSSNLGMVFMPKEDRSQFEVIIKANANISMEEMKKTTINIQKELLSISEVDYSSLTIGLNGNIYESSIYVRLVPIDKRAKTQRQIMEEIRHKSKTFENIEINVNETDDMNSGAEIMTPFQLILKANDSKLAEESANKLIDYLKTINGTTNIQNNIQPKKDELSIEILKQNSSKFGVKSSDIANVIAMAYSGEITISNFNKNGKEYDIVMRLSDDLRTNIDVINQLNVKNDKEELIPLSSLININTKQLASVIKRYNRQKQVTVGTDMKDGLALDTLINLVVENKDKWLLDGVTYTFEGDAKDMQDTSDAFGVAIVAALIMIYLILASLYESPLQPIIIMSAMPLSFTGAFLGLYLANMNMSLFSMMGLFLLLGLVGKNSTLIVDAANRNRENNTTLDEAIIQAGISRLRPILMTTISMCLGMLPLALSIGEGSSIKAPMAISVISGLIISTMLSLFVVPALYKLIAPLDDKIRKLYTHK